MTKAISPGCKAAMSVIAVAAIVRHELRMPDRREWLQRILKLCEAKAIKIAAQTSHSDATFIEAYAETLPALLTAALDAHELA